MNLLENNYLMLICTGITAFVFAYLLIPVVIKFVKIKKLLDQPDKRKQHKIPTPTLGGIGIFGALLAAILFWLDSEVLYEVKYLLFSISILFVMGIWDDLKDLTASKKFAVQIIVSFIIAASGLRIASLHGLLGIYEIPLWLQYCTTVFLLVGVTNAVNLLDGIDGLAGGIVGMNTIIFAFLFMASDSLGFSLIAIALTGALLGFLHYNFNPARIFMGDTGSLVIGFLLVVFGIKYLQLRPTESASSVIVVYSLLLLPVFDTLRVSAVRLLKGKSPFLPDRNHIHHLLIKSGYNHKQSALIMYVVNALLIAAGMLLSTANVSPLLAILLLTFLAVLLSELLSVKRMIKINNKIKTILKERDNNQKQNYLLLKLNKADETSEL